MSNSKFQYDVVSKTGSKVFAEGVTTRAEARQLKNLFQPASIIQRKYQLVSNKTIR